MIAAKLEGRLGNQLFQYAFIFAAAKKLGTKFYIDQRIAPFLLPKYFDIPQNSFSVVENYIFGIKGFKNFFNHHCKTIYFVNLQRILGLKHLHFSNEVAPERELEKIKNHTLYSGFFHSYKYFEQYGKEVLHLFAIKDRYTKLYKKIANENIPKDKTLIVVHIRKGDYMQIGLNLPMSYYHDAIKCIKVDNPFYIFLSDEPNTITDFEYLPSKYISHNEEIIDLQFLINADICILSNSSYSWWGAFLNEKSRQVIVPKFWSGMTQQQEYPIQAILPHWHQLESFIHDEEKY